MQSEEDYEDKKIEQTISQIDDLIENKNLKKNNEQSIHKYEDFRIKTLKKQSKIKDE